MVSGVNGRASDNAPKAVAVERARKHENAQVCKTEENPVVGRQHEHFHAMNFRVQVIFP